MHFTRGFFGAILAIALLGLAGCSSFRVTTDFDPQANFEPLRNYAWLENVRKPSDDPRLHNSLVDSRVRAAVDRELATKGYSKTPASSADFLVTYYLGLETKIDVHTIHSGLQMSRAGLALNIFAIVLITTLGSVLIPIFLT